MRTLFGETVFTIAKEPYFWEDVVLAGLLWGDWPVLERDLRYGLACLARSRAEGVPPSREQLDSAAASFRYERDLVSAQEARAWLARWKLGAEDWTEYLRRSVARACWPSDDAGTRERFPPADAEVDRCLHAEAVCSGTLTGIAHDLAHRAACTADGPPAQTAAVPGAAGLLATYKAASIDAAVAAACWMGLSAARCRERLALLARVERAYQAFRARVLTSRAIDGEIQGHRLEWMRVACESIAFEQNDAAREALLCMRADGQKLREVAAAARRETTPQLLCLDDMEAALRDQLRAARAGEIVGPVATEGAFVLLQVNAKLAPSADDPEIRRRAEAGLLSRLTLHELAPRVEWLTTP